MTDTLKSGKLIILSAPSGAGKSTLVNHLLKKDFDLEFSISATSRQPRGKEIHAREYYFLSTDEFKKKIDEDQFLEFEEVYADCFYGTLRTEVERIITRGKNVIFDVDVVGGLRIKEQYKDKAISIFIAPPHVDELRNRLEKRASDTPEKIEERIKKAEYELGFADKFDKIVVNDNLERAKKELEQVLKDFLFS